MKDKKAFIFYFLMTLILLDFGNHLRKISQHPLVENISNSFFSIVLQTAFPVDIPESGHRQSAYFTSLLPSFQVHQ